MPECGPQGSGFAASAGRQRRRLDRHRTDFTYGTTGQVLTVTGPAPSGSGDRPQVRYSYTSSSGESLLSEVSSCASGVAPACVGTAAESRQVIGYDAQGNVTSLTRRDGTGNLSAAEAMTYDVRGNVLSVDGPLSGTADTVRMRYDAGSRLVGTVSADPDGSGSLPHRAMRTTYSNGLPTKQEVGTVASQSDTDWAGMTVAQESQTLFDANARAVVGKLVSGSTIYSLTQISYDALGRPHCTAQRMNPAEYGNLPSDACTLDTEGSYGPDRIVKTSYNAAGQPTLVQSGYGITGVEANEVTATYTGNGLTETLTDGEGSKTTYVYDGHDRLSRTRMPSPTTDGASSTTDYEELTYDAGGNVTNLRLRDGTSIAMTYDALGRPTLKDLPGSEPDVTYGYDLLGRLTSAATSAETLTFTHDALGRQLTETGPLGTMTSTYDIAGRRTRLTYPGSFYVDYDHLVTGETSAIRENGATSGAGVLATFGYDALGRRTAIARGNGAATGYGYDAVGRLNQLTQDLSGTTNDLTLTFSHNPAGQIVGTTRSNDAYSFTSLANAAVSDTHNGLNQVTQTGAANVAHEDGRGNTTSVGSTTYSYNSENMLTGTSGGATLSQDLARHARD
jgi:YD repeat-containing protein